MKITKYTHACLVVEENNQQIVIDPGEYTTDLPELTNVVAIIITHEHGDHFAPKRLANIIRKNPQTKIYTLESITGKVPDLPCEIVAPADEVSIGHFSLTFFGGQHAPIVADISPCKNLGVQINGLVAYPGDSFNTPPTQPRVLAVPASAPWLKTYESMQYIEKVKPEIVFPTHNGLLSEFGQNVTYNWLARACNENAVALRLLAPSESIDL